MGWLLAGWQLPEKQLFFIDDDQDIGFDWCLCHQVAGELQRAREADDDLIPDADMDDT